MGVGGAVNGLGPAFIESRMGCPYNGEGSAHYPKTMADTAETKPRKDGSHEPARKRDEDPIGKVYDSRLAGRLLRYVRPYWLQAVISSVSVTLKSVCDVTGPIMVMMTIDRYIAPNLKSQDASERGGPLA